MCEKCFQIIYSKLTYIVTFFSYHFDFCKKRNTKNYFLFSTMFLNIKCSIVSFCCYHMFKQKILLQLMEIKFAFYICLLANSIEALFYVKIHEYNEYFQETFVFEKREMDLSDNSSTDDLTTMAEYWNETEEVNLAGKDSLFEFVTEGVLVRIFIHSFIHSVCISFLSFLHSFYICLLRLCA